MHAGKTSGRVPRPVALVLATLFAALALLGVGSSVASASTDPSEEPSGPVLSIGGILRDGDDPVEGVEITVEGGGFEQTAISDENGRWSVEVPEEGDYTVTLDPDTLPDGLDLRDPERTTANVSADEWQTNSISRLFPLGEDTRQTSGFADLFLQRLVSGLNFGLLVALAAIGITLIFGTTGLNNFAHGEMVTFGGILSWVFAVLLGLNIFIAIPIVVILGAAFGYLQDTVLWRPLRRKGVKLVQAMIVSIGLAIFLRYFYLFMVGGDTKTMNVGLSDAIVIGPVRITTGSLLSMGLSVVVLVAVGLFLTRTRTGKATRAVSDNPSLAAASGIDVDRIIRTVWIIAGGLAGLAGVMLALYRQVSWDMGQQVLLLMFAAVTLGGLGSAYGALVGSIVVGLFVELSTLFIPADLKYAAALIVLIVVLLVRPQGILGRRERIG
ncbi:amino acid/amide ABC transporter membrane protein 1 (HAAT family) [Labedella gwakjiensis]|uniref:Amino acid/amide ABC transporter membrane protein 1 (HAAT family) n=1 Tax=Labedella gwakjiensis TaxID=390269 RepID=A0A2P8GRW6_9MICO|nr:branched-chain amino acid ABC transporter permease [Labedella gwakjiensis]PSL36692.1 amino acid/amide ABC transporter membrane protein 1 (HAAT family) [Labedella gwakjiensis]